MNFSEIKVIFDIKVVDKKKLDTIFEKIDSMLNIRFDENFTPHTVQNKKFYKFKDVSALSHNAVENEISSFFNYTFDEIIDVALYKFFVLKNNEKLTILAIIHSSIFDYTSINKLYGLFNNVHNTSFENNILNYYSYTHDYLNSLDFKEDSFYWKNHLLDNGDYVKFYNVQSDNYKNIKIPLNNNTISAFLNQYDFSKFELITAILSLYLSRVNRTKGCLLKTIIPSNNNDFNHFDKNTLLKIPFLHENSFIEYLNEIKKDFDFSIEHTKVNIEYYIEDELSYYSVYDLTKLKDISVINGFGCALTFNIYNDYLEIIYNSDLFCENYMENMGNNVESLIDNIFDYYNQPLKEINILSEEEKSILSDFCKGEYMEMDENPVLSIVFRENAINNPDDIVIDDGVNQVSFGELEKSSNSIAYDLRENYGIRKGSRVALMLHRNYHYPELILALNKIGAVYIPIDLFFPIKRIEYMLKVSRAKCVITTEDIANSSELKTNIILLEDLNSEDDVDVEIVSSGDDLFTIIFTSGTTGLPKGIKVVNKQVRIILLVVKGLFNFSKDNVVGLYFGFSFVASFVLFVPLIFGGCCRIFNENEQKDSLFLIKELKQNPMHSIILPPSVGIPLYENEDLKLDYMMVGGAKLNELSKTERHTKIANIYGTSEILLGAIKTYDLNNIEDDKAPIGKPIANTWIYILDENNNIMPIGVPGEICVSNNYLSPGYINNSDLTNDSFVDNPFSDCDANKRMYRTGDIGFYNFEGEIEIIGREDDQLSVRGFRIESGEILNVMKGFKEISDIYLDVDCDNLIAYYTTNDYLDIDDVKNALKNELPQYMIPSLFVELDEIPLNQNGKIDKAALKRIFKETSDINIDDEVLFIVVNAFKEVLNRDFILIDDEFVELGGNSLSAMNLQLLLKERLNVSLSSSTIVKLSTPVNIANHIRFSLKAHSSSEINYSFDDKCPLLESQLNVYLDEKVNNMGTAYNNPFKIKFNEQYDFNEIKKAILKLCDIHPILNARIIEDTKISLSFDGKPLIVGGSNKDIDYFVRPFDLNEYLARFLYIEEESLLCADFHHLVFDGTSLSIIVNDLIDILNGVDLDSIDYGFLRQVSFEENSIDSDYKNDAKTFFDNMLADLDETSDLLESVKINNPDESTYINSFDIDNNQLNSFLQNCNITRNQFFCSVFAYALSRFTGSSKVLFNLIEDGRGHVDLSNSVGMFVRTLPLLVNCENQNVESYVKDCSSLVNSAMFNDLYPFRLLASEYDLNSNILFQYSHNLFNNNINIEKFGYSVDDLGHNVVGDLSFFIFDLDNEKLGIRILYSDKYSSDFIKSFVESYKLILHEMINADELSDINYTQSGDIGVLDSYNMTESSLVYDDILDVFNDNLSKYPNNDLVACRDVSYTYMEGAFVADKIAKSLIDIGVEKEDCVAFLVERSELYMFSILGILSVGAVYVPLDDVYPDERLQFILKDSGSDVVIASDETYNRAKNISDGLKILNVSGIVGEEKGKIDKLPAVYGYGACILYTSGTSGVPKGVKITRKSLINFAAFYVKKYALGESDIFALFASISFDVSMEGIFSSIYAGACLNVIPDDIKLDIGAMNDYFIEYSVTYTHLPAQVAKLFIAQNDDISLKVLCTGGEKLGKIEMDVDYRFIDSYGPTETFVDVTSIDIDQKIDSSSIGHLFDNIKAYVLDNEFRRVPIGAVGELFLAGYQVANGYLNRPEETENAFLDNPFEYNEDYGIMYRTGDLVRVLPDGSLGIVGRHDSQVKIRGNRVELSEVEHIIREIDYIEDVTVQTIRNETNNELVAYVVVSKDVNDDDLTDMICDYVRAHKPDYMVPSFVVSINEIPLNVNGKVDKHALPDVDMSRLRAEYVAPRNETERKIVEAFEKVFNQDNVGIYDDFIRLGGDSLTAIKLITYLEDYNITVADVLSLHTPYSIAKVIEKISFDLDIYDLDSGCPLNEPQLNIYLDIVANEKVDSYLNSLVMKIPDRYDVNEIIDALNLMFDVHPILSMHIDVKSETPYLIKGSKPSILVKSDIIKENIAEFLTHPFDLENNLSRFLIIENEGDNYLFAVFHHIIFDAISRNIFEEDLYSILNGESIDFDDSFLKLSAFNQQIHNTDEYIKANNFYESMLEDSDEVGTLLDCVSADGPGVEQTDLDLDIDLFEHFLNKHNINGNIVFTGVFAYTLSRFTDEDKVLFNILENGRDRLNNFYSIGMFVNTLPLLVDCNNQDISSFMQYMSSLVYNVMKYNYYPFRLLTDEYNINSNIIFQFLPEWIKNEVESDNNIFMEETLNSQNDFITDFAVNLIQKGDSYNLNIIYSDKYSKDFVERFMETYKQILHEIICVKKLGNINYISKNDLELLDTINQTEHDLDYEDILDAFNDNLAKYPNNNLVGMNGSYYTFEQGAFIADKIAKKLFDLGIESNENVAFLVKRCEFYMFSVLGILSTGASYVPLDDTLPTEHIKFILNDSNSKAIIVSDETYEFARNLREDIILLNISDILKENIGRLSNLPVVYGNLACIHYTSGTTGTPKGVKVTRKSLLNVSEVYRDIYDINHDDVYALFSTIGFDAGSFAISTSIYSGCLLVVVPEEIRSNIIKLNEYFVGHNVTHTMLTTQIGKLFMENIDETSLDVLLVGGEKLGEFKNTNDYHLIDGFGPTETFAFITSINNKDKIDSSSIGKLNYNTKAYILDNELRQVPIGAVGELFIAGKQVADGYINLDEETNKAFINNPFDDNEEYDVLYRTGDLVRVLSDNTLGIVNRKDGQIKIRGNRVELSEVESTIRSMDCIKDATVQTIKNNENYDLVAYVVTYDDVENLKDVVCDYVTEHKPSYMVPSFVIQLDAIPLNTNGKVDTNALPKVDLDSLHEEYVAPTNETEETIVNAFEKVFNQKIGIHDDFVRLGGNSLISIKIVSLLSDMNISVSSLFRYRTPYKIAKNIVKNKEYGFELIKEGTVNQNMFLLPPQAGLSLAFLKFVNSIDFEGNIYVIDDFKYGLTIDEIVESDDCNLTLSHYYDAIKDIFHDGDIICGYSLGCIFALLLAEKLEKTSNVGKCILIDGTLNFVHEKELNKEEVINNLIEDYGLENYNKIIEKYPNNFKDKLIEILIINSKWDFHTPKIDSHIIYLSTSNSFKEELDEISSDYEFIHIDSNHRDIIKQDCDKIAKYFN